LAAIQFFQALEGGLRSGLVLSAEPLHAIAAFSLPVGVIPLAVGMPPLFFQAMVSEESENHD
jgi:hypothetical protein